MAINPGELCESEEYRIPDANFADLEERIKQLNRRAARLHCPPIVLRSVHVEEQTDDQTGAVHITHVVTVMGAAPRIPGWQFVATLNHVDEGTIISAVPGASQEGELAGYRDARPWCDHCRTVRARTDTFLLREESTGALKQVGRQCLRDFLGHPNPEHLCFMAEIIAQALRACEDSLYGGGHAEYRMSSVFYLAHVAAYIRMHGWLSRSKARELGEYTHTATADAVLSCLDHVHGCTIPARCSSPDAHYTPTDADTEQARAALEWARNLPQDSNDYLYNCRTLAQGQSFDLRFTGLVASIVPSYQRTQAQERERAQARQASHHVGTAGKRADFAGLRVVRAYVIDGGMYGPSTRYLLIDGQGNRFTWKASGTDHMQEGDTVTLRGTVKEHSYYRDIAETVLTRCAVQASEAGK